ncbi:MAG: sialidase family protein [Parafilimonas sp.]
MKKISALTVFILMCFIAMAQQKKVPVFVSGTEGYKSFRIPAIIKLPNGSLLAFCEGRVHGSGDFGDVNIVLKRSNDNGKTWSPLQTVVDNDLLQAGNCAPVVDMMDAAYPQGRIFLFYNTGNNNESEVRKGNGLREVWYKTSIDNGNTWSDAVNITTQVHKPKQPQINAAYNFAEDWRSFANTPGHAIQLSHGSYKGRIYIAANHSAGNPQPHGTDYKANGFYTDDHDKTFHISDDVNIAGGNENMATELSGDKLMLNLRNQCGDKKERIIAISNNGGALWDTAYFDQQLPDPVCQGSILTIGEKNGNAIIAVCNNADTVKRDNLTLRISYDEGKTFKKNIVIAKSTANYNGDYTAYSDIVQISKKEIGVLYEYDNYKEIIFCAVEF